MNREHLRSRKILRELSFFLGLVAIVIAFFWDTIAWVFFPAAPIWLHLAIYGAGAVLLILAGAVTRLNKRLGAVPTSLDSALAKPPRDDDLKQRE
jgi:MFS superfamily sulfate permease-like transporter